MHTHIHAHQHPHTDKGTTKCAHMHAPALVEGLRLEASHLELAVP